MLKTWEYGNIELVKKEAITVFDTYLRDDIIGEYSYYQLPDGSVVAVDNWGE